MSKSLNRCQLIGNLTRDPELRYTPQGTAVCNFTIATNRSWKSDSDDDSADFHRLVAWDKLAEICGKYLKKGRKVYVEGRIQTRSWDADDGQKKYITEVVVNDMIMLGGQGDSQSGGYSSSEGDFDLPDDFNEEPEPQTKSTKKPNKSTKNKSSKAKSKKVEDDDDEIPF